MSVYTVNRNGVPIPTYKTAYIHVADCIQEDTLNCYQKITSQKAKLFFTVLNESMFVSLVIIVFIMISKIRVLTCFLATTLFPPTVS